MTAGRCKWAGCSEPTAATHCEPHRVKFNDRDRNRGGRGDRYRVEGQCEKCFQPGHTQAKCLWTPSIFASGETPAQAAARIR